MENNKAEKLEKEIVELRKLISFKRECLAVALENRLCKMQTILSEEINELRAELCELRYGYSSAIEGMKAVTIEELKEQINKDYKCRH